MVESRDMKQTMTKVFFPLTFLLLLNIITFSSSTNSEYKHRTKRKVVFNKSMKFFIRFNGKDNMLNYTEIFAHGWTFRINYDLPETLLKRHQFFKRDVHAELDTVTDDSSFNLYSCILKYLCETVESVKLSQQCGILCEIGNIIARTATMESEFFQSFLNNCDYHNSYCPYLFRDSSMRLE